MKLLTLREELETTGNFYEDNEMMIGIDNRYCECVKAQIAIKELFKKENKKLLNKKVKDVLKGHGEIEYIFILNSK